MSKIDAHHHLWAYDPVDYDWIDGSMSQLQHDFLLAELVATTEAAGVVGTIVVQARQHEKENEFLLKLANKSSLIKGVIGWLDLCSPQLSESVKQYIDEPKLKGFRHVLQGEDNAFMLKPDFINGIQYIGKLGYCYEILVFHHQLSCVRQLLKQLSPMKLVIDHIAKPDLIQHTSTQWFDDIAAIAKHHPHVYCKLSGMITEASWLQWQPKDIYPYIDHIIECFGGKRVMFGSDWPVCLVAGQYQEVVNLLEDRIEMTYPHLRNAIFNENATAFYQL